MHTNPNKDGEFDRQLREKFDNFTPEVSADLWDKIEAQLDATPNHGAVPMAKLHRRLPNWWMAVAATILMVCGVAYWYNRPIEVTYLQGQAAIAEKDEAKTEANVSDVPEQKSALAPEPLDTERLKQLFAKKERKRQGINPARAEDVHEATPKTRSDEVVKAQQWVATTVQEKETPFAERMTTATAEDVMDQVGQLEEALAKVPDVQPLVVLTDEEETMLASTEGKQSFGLSNILNYVVSTVDQREEKLVTFSNDREGSLKLDFNFGLAKNKKKKIK